MLLRAPHHAYRRLAQRSEGTIVVDGAAHALMRQEITGDGPGVQASPVLAAIGILLARIPIPHHAVLIPLAPDLASQCQRRAVFSRGTLVVRHVAGAAPTRGFVANRTRRVVLAVVVRKTQDASIRVGAHVLGVQASVLGVEAYILGVEAPVLGVEAYILGDIRSGFAASSPRVTARILRSVFVEAAVVGIAAGHQGAESQHSPTELDSLPYNCTHDAEDTWLETSRKPNQRMGEIPKGVSVALRKSVFRNPPTHREIEAANPPRFLPSPGPLDRSLHGYCITNRGIHECQTGL
jgi:hypothetical protein